MADPVGHLVPLSLGRRVVGDFLRLSRSLPMVTIEKTMNVADVVAARQRLALRPSWCAIFTKAYGKVVQARAEMRRAYLTIPWERLFEYTDATADIVIAATIEAEESLVTVPLRDPAYKSLLDIDRRLAWCKEQPIERVGSYRRARRLARFPRFVRDWTWWYALGASGRLRSRYFATFGVTSVANAGVESLRPLAPWTSLLHYGTIDSQGNVAVRLTYDHRVLDGSGPSLALVAMERVLATDIIAELTAMNAAVSLAA